MKLSVIKHFDSFAFLQDIVCNTLNDYKTPPKDLDKKMKSEVRAASLSL